MSKAYILRVELTDWEGNFSYAEYSNFSIGGPESNYNAHYSGGLLGNCRSASRPM